MKFFDRVKETTTTTGTGSVTLAGAVTGFRAFQDVYSTGDFPIPYVIIDANGTGWETGWGTLSASTTFARTWVKASTNSNNAISLSSGTHTVFVGDIADFLAQVQTLGQALAMMAGYAIP